MGTLTVLPPKGPQGPKEPDPNIIALLHNLLVRAMAGEINGIAVAFLTEGNIATAFEYEEERDFAALIGAVSVLNSRVSFDGD